MIGCVNSVSLLGVTPIYEMALPDPSLGLEGSWDGKLEVEVGSDWVLTRLLDMTCPTFSLKNFGGF